MTEKKQLREENCRLEDEMKEKQEAAANCKKAYETSLSTLASLHSELESIRSALHQRQEEQEALEAKRSDLTALLNKEEESIGNCALRLEEEYAKRHSELTAAVESNRAKLEALKDEIQKTSLHIQRG